MALPGKKPELQSWGDGRRAGLRELILIFSAINPGEGRSILEVESRAIGFGGTCNPQESFPATAVDLVNPWEYEG